MAPADGLRGDRGDDDGRDRDDGGHGHAHCRDRVSAHDRVDVNGHVNGYANGRDENGRGRGAGGDDGRDDDDRGWNPALCTCRCRKYYRVRSPQPESPAQTHPCPQHDDDGSPAVIRPHLRSRGPEPDTCTSSSSSGSDHREFQ